jgi:hypothetical protein
MPASAERVATSSARSRKIAYWLDNAFRVPGTQIRFGLDPLMGLVPGLGDVVGGVLSVYIVLEAARAGASAPVLLRMLANLGLDMLFAAVPLIGDLFDAGFKANTRNMALLHRHLQRPDEAHAASRTFLVVVGAVVVVLVVGTATLAALSLQWLLNALAY